ncbi:MAG: TetR/AcrR family transcriptional regulator [Myxococcales bacterium]|nr:TetR/AcrR family transcriptional regulator [Myxococcales bacterium]
MSQSEPAADRVLDPTAPAVPARHEADRRRDPEETKLRLLDAAEHLFAERGFDGASLRAVTQAARTSVSAAHYHFGSKEALLVATIERRLAPILRARLDRLDALEREAAGAPLAIEAILDAFLRPIFEERAARADAGDGFRRIAARLFSDPPPVVADLKQRVFGETMERFMAVLEPALPDRSREAIALDLQFLVGIMIHVTSGHLEDAPGPSPLPDLAGLSDETVLQRMIQFAAAGIRAAARSPR